MSDGRERGEENEKLPFSAALVRAMEMESRGQDSAQPHGRLGQVLPIRPRMETSSH